MTTGGAISSEGKTIAVISYLTIIGTIVALFMNSSRKDPFAWFHLRQMIGLGLTSLMFWALSHTPLLGVVFMAANIGLVVLWVLGLINAINGSEKPIPIVGEYYQNWFSGLR